MSGGQVEGTMGGDPHATFPTMGPAPSLVLAHSAVQVGYCQGCHDEYNELLRDKRGELELDCPFWQAPMLDEKLIGWLDKLPQDASPAVQRLAATLAAQAGREEPSCQCPHLLAAGTPHLAPTGKRWCPGGQHAHGPEHGEDLCLFPDFGAFVFQRSGGHMPTCADASCGTVLRCVCPNPEVPHLCPEHAPAAAAEPAVSADPRIAVLDAAVGGHAFKVTVCPNYEGGCQCPEDGPGQHLVYTYALKPGVDLARCVQAALEAMNVTRQGMADAGAADVGAFVGRSLATPAPAAEAA